MPTIVVVDQSGDRQEQTATSGTSLMEALRDLGAVEAICGGGASCGTCAIRVDGDWSRYLPPPDMPERELLEGLDYGFDGCRLSCQVVISDATDGMVVHLLSIS